LQFLLDTKIFRNFAEFQGFHVGFQNLIEGDGMNRVSEKSENSSWNFLEKIAENILQIYLGMGEN